MHDPESASVATLGYQFTERDGLLFSQSQGAEVLGRPAGGLR